MSSHEIELNIVETVTRGGVRRITWHVKQGDAWVSAATFPGVRLDNEFGGPGVIWQRQLLLSLPAGAELMRVESSPENSPTKDPIDYLWSARRGVDRSVHRSYFRVNAQGKLQRLTRRPT